MTKEQLALDLISPSSVSFYNASAHVCVLVPAGVSVSRDSSL